MYTSSRHFHAYHHTFSLTQKCVPVVRNFMPMSRFQFNTEMYTTGIHFCAGCGVVSSRGLMSDNFDQMVTTQLCSRAILVIPALPRLAQILPSVEQW